MHTIILEAHKFIYNQKITIFRVFFSCFTLFHKFWPKSYLRPKKVYNLAISLFLNELFLKCFGCTLGIIWKTSIENATLYFHIASASAIDYMPRYHAHRVWPRVSGKFWKNERRLRVKNAPKMLLGDCLRVYLIFFKSQDI